ncbi:MAG: hypothetical protein EAZ37_17405 [Burkholderiales bacterium]|nr:MAG: hypothetical protein EAZ43_11540 [Betaproteobacteria bacterium]TAG23917.1 MAG: hypothetical protein EAZ37_17405 [Burkholderiales bacterium]
MLNELIAKLQTAGITIPAGPISIDHYGDSPELSASLIELIRSGAKRAGTIKSCKAPRENSSQTANSAHELLRS